MSDDRLFAALKRLGAEELPAVSDRVIRGRLETAWTARGRATAMPRFGLRRFAPVVAGLVLVAGLGGSALGASADSPLWDTRVALEEAGAALRQSPADRVAYLLDLVASRTEEAARQEAAGHPDAAAKARAAASTAVIELDGSIPRIDTSAPTPSAAVPVVVTSPSPTPRPDSSSSPSASASPALQSPSSASPTSTPTRTVAPTPVRTDPPTATPVRTPIPPTATKPPVTITGTVRDSTGATVYGACISTSSVFPTSTTQCSVKTTTNGSYVISAPIDPGQTITLYGYWINTTGGHFSASATATVTAPTTLMPTMNLTPQK